MVNKTKCRPDYHINLVYCGGCCFSKHGAYNQTLKLFERDDSKHCLIVCSSSWTDYHDTIEYIKYKFCCMISNGNFINIPKPYDINNEYGDECVIVKLTSGNETKTLITSFL